MKVIDIKEALPSNDNWVMALNNKGFLGLAKYSEGNWYIYDRTASRMKSTLEDCKLHANDNDIVAWILI